MVSLPVDFESTASTDFTTRAFASVILPYPSSKVNLILSECRRIPIKSARGFPYAWFGFETGCALILTISTIVSRAINITSALTHS